MNKLLIITGPTATGKTKLGLQLAKEFGGEIISADSRQVYTGMDIGTGKDIPHGATKHLSSLIIDDTPIPYYQTEQIKIWGYDLVTPKQPFSAAHFVQVAATIIKHLWNQNTLPIIVGGTGYYIKSLINPPETLGIPPDKQLRKKLQNQSIESLQQLLRKLDSSRFKQMNRSDRQNPRRLIRAIEVAQSNQSKQGSISEPVSIVSSNQSSFKIGLKLPIEKIEKRIKKRVTKRLNQGMIQEVRHLKLNQLKNQLPATATIGYQQIQAYLSHKISKQQAVKEWQTAELQYAKRQLTWFKKQSDIHWYNPLEKNDHNHIVSLVSKWYTEKSKNNLHQIY